MIRVYQAHIFWPDVSLWRLGLSHNQYELDMSSNTSSGPYWVQNAEWMGNHYEVPVIASIIYVVTIFGIQHAMKTREAFGLKKFLALWNFFLGGFSMIGAYYVVPAVVTVWMRDGIQAEMCTLESERANPWVYLFCLSKLPEFVDTLFIVLRKANLRFLHWYSDVIIFRYHHIATMLYCWDAWAVQVENGGMFAGMNLLVHSVMYTYYGLTALGFRFSNPVRKSITNIQILQMLLGTLICVVDLLLTHPAQSLLLQLPPTEFVACSSNVPLLRLPVHRSLAGRVWQQEGPCPPGHRGRLANTEEIGVSLGSPTQLLLALNRPLRSESSLCLTSFPARPRWSRSVISSAVRHARLSPSRRTIFFPHKANRLLPPTPYRSTQAFC